MTLTIFLSFICFGLVQGQPEVTSKFYNLVEQKKAAEKEYHDVLAKLAPEHPKAKEIKNKIDDITRRIAELPVDLSTPKISPEAEKIILEITVLKTRLGFCGIRDDCQEAKKKLANSYQKAVLYPEVVQFLLSEAIQKSDANEINLLLVVQNQRMITLLNFIESKK